MNMLRRILSIAKQPASVLQISILILASAQAQTPITAGGGRGAANSNTISAAQFRFSDLLAQARTRRRAFALMPESRLDANANSLNVTAAAAPSAVHGSGTVGTIPMWSETRPSGNPLLGDSVITQLNGNIGIGVVNPESKLTASGIIEATSGGFKFPDGTVQTTAAVSGLQSIFHDATLKGLGTSSEPLGVAIPLSLIGAGSGSVLTVRHTEGGFGLSVEGSAQVKGADFPLAGFAALGLQATGGHAPSGGGGDGVEARGGDGIQGGQGVSAFGGNSSGAIGGNGVEARGGDNTNVGFGGHGVVARGGTGIGAGRKGGIGLIAQGGAGQEGATMGDAAHFIGHVDVTGNLSKGGGSFKIDHPLDPENRYLYHSFVESPDMKNIYDGNVTTDENGEAAVTLPAYFEALNSDFRYQLTVIGTFAQAIVAGEIKDNRFVIRTNAPNVKVSWQVTGIRRDAFANKNRINVEEEKPERERGYYLHPEAFNQPEDRSIEWARNPELMRHIKESRLKQKEVSNRQAQSKDH